MKRKRIRNMFISVVISICLCITFTLSHADAANLNTITPQQLEALLNEMEGVIGQLEGLGLDDEQIEALFSVNRTEAASYTETASDMTDTSELFVQNNGNSMPLNSSNESSERRVERLRNIYSIGLRYCNSDFNQVPKISGESDSEWFCDYMKYLYISYYIDGPDENGVTDDDFPYIISTDDIYAYNCFLDGAKNAEFINNIASLVSDIYSVGTYPRYLSEVSQVGQSISSSVNQLVAAAPVGYSFYDASKIISGLAADYLVNNYDKAPSGTALEQDTLEYVSNQLTALNFYDNYDMEYTQTVVTSLTSTFIGVMTASCTTLLGVYMGLTPLLVKNAATLFEVARITALRYSFSARLAIRTDIYIESEF